MSIEPLQQVDQDLRDLKKEFSAFKAENANLKTEVALLKQELDSISSDISYIRDNMVTKASFSPIQRAVYTSILIVISGFIAGLMSFLWPDKGTGG